MNKIPGKTKLLNRLISLSAAGLLVSSAGVAYAAGDSQSSTDQAGQQQSQQQQSQQQQNQQKVNAPQFSDVDQDRNQRLVWTEIYTFYDDEIDRAGWQEQDVMDQYDSNQDAGLDENEYIVFVTTLAAEPGSNISQDQGQDQNQELGQTRSGQSQSSQDQAAQGQSDQQAMAESEQGQPQTDREADPGSAEYYDEQDRDAVAGTYEQDMQDAQPADIASDQQQQDQGQDEMASTQGQQSGQQQDQGAAGSASQGNQAQQSGAASDQNQAADGTTTTTIIAITDIPDLTVEDLEDRHVVNLNGEDIGEVEEVIFGADGAVTGLVVGVGGFWDIGDKDVYANAAEVRVSGDQLVWETTLDEESLEELPEYEAPEVSIIE